MANKINRPNFILASIDPGVNIGIAIFAIENYQDKQKIKIKCIMAIQKNFTKKFDFLDQDIRAKEMHYFIYNILLKYKVSLVCLEEAHFSCGRFSYSENLLARYSGIIYITVLALGIHIISMSYKSMQKLIINNATVVKDKAAIMSEISKIYKYEIKKTHFDKLDALGYGYAVYNALLYYHAH